MSLLSSGALPFGRNSSIVHQLKQNLFLSNMTGLLKKPLKLALIQFATGKASLSSLPSRFPLKFKTPRIQHPAHHNPLPQAPTNPQTSPAHTPKSSKPHEQAPPSSFFPSVSTPPTAPPSSRAMPKPCSPPRPPRPNLQPTTPYRR